MERAFGEREDRAETSREKMGGSLIVRGTASIYRCRGTLAAVEIAAKIGGKVETLLTSRRRGARACFVTVWLAGGSNRGYACNAHNRRNAVEREWFKNAGTLWSVNGSKITSINSSYMRE